VGLRSSPAPVLALILLTLEAATKRLGIDWSLKSFKIMWDIRALIAAFVVVTFCIAALGGSNATETIKDVALVVIGFYFGGLGRPRPGEGTAGQVTINKTPGLGGTIGSYETGEDEERPYEPVSAPEGTGESLGENMERARRSFGNEGDSTAKT
jgi:hypothetical protein